MIHFSWLAVALLCMCIRDKQLPPTRPMSRIPHFSLYAFKSQYKSQYLNTVVRSCDQHTPGMHSHAAEAAS